MDLDMLKEQIIQDEGQCLAVYKCTEGHKTVGVGHMLKRIDPEFDFNVGDTITQERSDELLEQDLDMTIKDCIHAIPTWDYLPEEVQLICANMIFNLGRSRFMEFALFRRALQNQDWKEAAAQMTDSLWHRQLPNRSTRLIKRMENVDG
jgi:GH24 family phage-related lysozyme (muramidase)